MAKRRAHKSKTEVEVFVSPDQIAQRAYEKWLARGCQGGNAEQDWFEAERELRAELNHPVVQTFMIKFGEDTTEE